MTNIAPHLPVRYRWTKDGEEFQPPYVTTQNNEHKHGTFVLLNKHLVSIQGKYRCYAFNKLGTAITQEIELMAPSEWGKQKEADVQHKSR